MFIEPPSLLRTGDRTKIPKAWSHPIGAEAISRALSGLPQYGHIYLRFLGSSMNARRPDDYFVLSASYSDPRTTMMKENWRVDVSAVPRTVCPKVKDLLLREGLPLVHAWLEAERNLVWDAGWKHLDMRFSIAGQYLTVAETGSA